MPTIPMPDAATLAAWEEKGLIPPGSSKSLKTKVFFQEHAGYNSAGERVLPAPDPLTITPPCEEGNAMADDQPIDANATTQHTFSPWRYLDEPSADSVLIRVTHEGEPTAKQRPRMALKTGRVYTPGSTKDHQKALALLAKPMLAGIAPDNKWAFGIRAVFYVQTHQRKDVDNMLKTVLDAMNRLAFADDCQVKELMGWSVVDHIRPRTEFVVYRLHPIDREQGECIVCRKKFRRYKSWKARLFCSRYCNVAYHKKQIDVNCSNCGKAFTKIQSKSGTKRSYCSNACRGDGMKNRIAVACTACGKEFSRPASHFKEGQTRFFCSLPCRNASTLPRGQTMTPDEMTAAARKGWETRRKQSAG